MIDIHAQTSREFRLLEPNKLNNGADKNNDQSRTIVGKTNTNGFGTKDSNTNPGILKPSVRSAQGHFQQSSNHQIQIQGFSIDKQNIDRPSTEKIDQIPTCIIQHTKPVSTSARPCRCGSTSHTCTTHPDCVLHRISPSRQTRIVSRGSQRKLCSYVHLDAANRKVALLTSARQLQHDLETWEPLIDYSSDVHGSAFSLCSSDRFDNPQVDLVTGDKSIISEYEPDKTSHLVSWSQIIDKYSSSSDFDSLDDDFWKRGTIL